MNLKMINNAINAYADLLDGADKARVDFFNTIWPIQAKAYDQAKQQEWEPLRESEALKCLKAGRPVFDACAANVDEALLVETAQAIIGLCVDSGLYAADFADELRGRNVERIVAASDLGVASTDPDGWLAQVCEILVDDGMSEAGARTCTLFFSMALKPQLEACAEKVMKQIRALGDKNKADKTLYCPVCGCDPCMAHVGGQTSSSGRGRLLVCPQCGSAWEFERVRCARCGTKNQQSLHFYHIEGDDKHRLATCDECGGYIKTIYSEDSLTPCSYEVEDVVMVKLDAVALDPSVAKGEAQ